MWCSLHTRLQSKDYNKQCCDLRNFSFVGGRGEKYAGVECAYSKHSAYIFQRPFLRGLFLEGLIFGGAYLRREICVSKSIGLAL